MRFISFQLQFNSYDPSVSFVKYTTDELEDSKWKPYQEFKSFMFGQCPKVEDKEGLLEAMDTYKAIVLNVRKGSWKVWHPKQPSYTTNEYVKMQQEQEQKEQLNSIQGMFTNLIDNVSSFVKSNNEKEWQDKIRKQ